MSDMIDNRTDEIVAELLAADPSMGERETEIREIVRRILAARPHVEIDNDFKERVLLETISKDRFAEKSRNISRVGRISFAATAAAALLVVVFLIPRHAVMETTKASNEQMILADESAPIASRGAPELAPGEKSAALTLQSKAKKESAVPSPAPAASADSGTAPAQESPRYAGVDAADTEEYNRIFENPFLPVTQSPSSTFALDVDTASYANVRRFLNQGRLPYPDAVRIEELINYFDYDYPTPRGTEPFSVHTELSTAPWAPEHLLLKIGIKGRDMDMGRLPPGNLVFLLDVSGSMEDPAKLPLLKSAMKLLVDRLRPVDRVSIVVYAGAAGLVLEPTPGNEKSVIMAALDRLEAGGSTAGGEGIELAYDTARMNFFAQGNNRVIIATDGDFNVGPSSDDELVRLIEKERESGVFLTVLGFGSGNYKDSKMESLADAGNGNYAYIDSIREARKVLVDELGATMYTIAKDVKIQVEFNADRVESYRLIGYENRLLAAEDFDDDTKDAGELGAGHTVTALYELIPANGNEKASLTGPEHRDTILKDRAEAPSGNFGADELLALKLRYKPADQDQSILMETTVPDNPVPIEESSRDFRFAASVAAWGMLLRGSGHAGSADFDTVLDMAVEAGGQDPNGYRREFVNLVRASAELADGE